MAEPGAAPAPEAPARGLAAGIVLAAVAAAYATAFRGGFQLDDWLVVVGDPRVQSLEAWWRSMPGIRPLLKLSYALNHASGLGLAGFHAVNVALHATNALLVLALLERLGRRLPAPPPRAAALLGALLFALHPVQTEAVTYVSGRSSALAATFALGSLLAFVAGRDRDRPALSLGLSPLLLAASLGAKEGAFVLPVALLLVEALDPRRAFTARAALRAVWAHGLVVCLAASAFLAAPPYQRMLSGNLALRDPLANVLTHARATVWLWGQLLRPLSSSADPALPPVLEPSPGDLLPLAAIVALLVTCLALLRRGPRPAAAFAGLWLLVWVAPQGFWLPRPELASERQLYLALAGPAWLAGIALAGRGPGRPARLALAAGLVLLLFGATAARSLVYADEVTFWSDVVRKAPHNARGHANLGHALALACRPAEAEAAFRRALEEDPGNVRAAANLGLLLEGALLPPETRARCAAGAAEGTPGAAP